MALAQGGSPGGNYAIYQISAIASGTQNAVVGIKPGNVNVTSTTANATMTYRLYATSTGAVAGGDPGLAPPTTGDIAKFGKALSFTLPTQGTQTAAVVDLYTKFKATAGNTAGPVSLGTMNYGVTGALKPSTGVAATLADLLTGANAVVEGDFSAFGAFTGTPLTTANVFLATPGSCASGSGMAPIIATDKLSASFALGTTPATYELCVKADGTTPIPATAFTTRLDVTAQTGTTTTNVPASAQGTILRDGTVLKVPFMFGGYAGQSTYVNLANTKTTPASYTATCFSPTGPVAATGTQKSGTIPAGSTVKVYMSGLGCGTTANAVEFTLAVPEGTVVGTLVRLNNTTGDSGYSDLTGNK